MKKGFTLIEVVIVLAIIAILVAIITPLVVNSLNQAKLAKAATDVKTLGEAIVNFRKDLGFWPVKNSSNNGIDMLYGVGNIPSSWNIYSNRLSFNYHLVDNSNNYRRGPSPEGLPCWNGPYLGEIKQDPWNNSYLANVRHLEGASSPDYTKKVWIISAGGNKVVDTDFNGVLNTTNDDLTFRLQ